MALNWKDIISDSGQVATFADEGALERGLNEATLPALFTVKAKEGKFIVASVDGGAIRSPEAQDVLDRFTGLTASEEDAIASFVDAESAAGRWGTKANNYTDSEYDAFWCFGLGTEAQALTQWHPLTPAGNAVNNGAVKTLDGFSFNGTTAFIDSGYNPSVSGINYQLNSAQAAVFVKVANSATNLANSASGFGVVDVGSINRLDLISTDTLDFFLVNNGSSGGASEASTGEFWKDDSLYTTTRTASNALANYRNGLNFQTNTRASQGIPTNSILIGARDNQGTPAGHFTGTLSTFQVGAPFTDQADHYNSLLELLIDLDVFAAPVIARYTALTPTEETALRNFINAEVRAGNFGKYDEFYPLFLSNATDSLTGFFSKTATNNGATQVSGGYDISGAANRIVPNFNPAVDGINYQANSATASLYVLRNVPRSANSSFSECTSQLRFVDRASVAQIRMNMNSVDNLTATFALASDQLILGIRESETSIKLFINGIQEVSNPSAGIGTVQNSEWNLGRTSALEAIEISYFMIGGALPDPVAHNTNLRNMLTAVGVLP